MHEPMRVAAIATVECGAVHPDGALQATQSCGGSEAFHVLMVWQR